MANLKPTKPKSSPPNVNGVLKSVGKMVNTIMEAKGLSSEEVAYIANLAPATVKKILAGTGSSLTTLILVCVALEMTPKEVFDFPMKLKPFNKLSTMPIKESSRPKYKKYLLDLIRDGWFSELKTTEEVCAYFKEKHKYNAETKNLSSILKRLVKGGHLYLKKIGRNNSFYYKKDT